MENLTVFYLEDCPYCHNARRALAELKAENPAYEAVPVTWVDENLHPEMAGQFDYYYVPSAFLGTRKLFEAHPGDSYAKCLGQMRMSLDAARGAEGSAAE